MKKCRFCNTITEETNFGFDYRYTPPRRRHICNECCRLRNIESRSKDRTNYNEKARERRYARKLRAIAYLGGICNHCGLVVHPAAFDFHHKNKDEKDKDPGLMMSTSDEKLFKELDKCLLLCANCHRIEHFENGY